MPSMKVKPDVFKQIDRPCNLIVPARRNDFEQIHAGYRTIYTNKNRERFAEKAWITITSDVGSIRAHVWSIRPLFNAEDCTGIVTGKSSLGYWVLDIGHIAKRQS